MGSSSSSRKLGFHSSNYWDGSEPLMVSGMSGLLSSCQRHFGILLELYQWNREASGDEAEIPAYDSCSDRDLEVYIDFTGVSVILSC